MSSELTGDWASAAAGDNAAKAALSKRALFRLWCNFPSLSFFPIQVSTQPDHILPPSVGAYCSMVRLNIIGSACFSIDVPVHLSRNLGLLSLKDIDCPHNH
ncbi:MAG: hypothetical protein QM605_11750 [Sphingobium sp.]